MTGIKLTVSLFSVWQRELDRVSIKFATLYIQLLSWLCTLSPTVLMSISWLLCHILWLWLMTINVWHDHDVTISMTLVTALWLCDCHIIFPMLHLSNNLKDKKRNINIDLAILPSHDKKKRKRKEKLNNDLAIYQVMIGIFCVFLKTSYWFWTLILNSFAFNNSRDSDDRDKCQEISLVISLLSRYYIKVITKLWNSKNKI